MPFRVKVGLSVVVTVVIGVAFFHQRALGHAVGCVTVR